jgi:hypothetical protein
MKNGILLSIRSVSMFLLVLCTLNTLDGQTVMPIPPHVSNFSGNSRGMWFTAPTDFIITGIRAPLDINSNAQSVHLVKFTAPPPTFSATTTQFTTLHYVSNSTATGFIPMNIQVNSGDVIGVMAVRNNGTGTGMTSYSSTAAPFTTNIGTHSVLLYRLGWQGSILNSPAVDFWTEANNPIGRVEIQYVLTMPTDAALTAMPSVTDTMCSGSAPVSVRLKNNGPSTLMETKINWKVNGTPQPVYQWNGSIAVNDSASVVIGSLPLLANNTYSIQAFVSDVNNDIDSFPANDTIAAFIGFVKPSPALTLLDTSILICNGDTARIIGTLTGISPWNLTIKDGSTTIPVTNLTQSSFNFPIFTNSSKAYKIVQLSDAGGCTNYDTLTVHIGVVPAPPAAITPMGGTTAKCAGDSVMLMASVGLNFGYEWMKDGILVPGATSYLLAAKQAGSYTVKVLSPAGCSSVSAPVMVFIHPAPVVNLGNDTAMLPGQTVILNAGAGFNSYLWSTGATTQTINASSAIVAVINYWVQVTDNNGCKGGDTIKINFTNHPGIEEYVKTMSVILIPNPASDLIEVVWNDLIDEPLTLNVITMDGRKVLNQNIKGLDGKALLDVSMLPAGNYLLQLSSARGNAMQRLVIVR